jgi:hypothetical protein
VEVQATGLSHFLTFVKALMLPEEDAFGDIAVGLAAIGGMGFLYVHHEEFDLISVPAADFFDALNLSTEWGSSVAAENQTHGTASLEAGQPDPLFGTHELKFKV